MGMEPRLLDELINRLVEARKNNKAATTNGGNGSKDKNKAVKRVQLMESEIMQLCYASKEIFLSQPNLLELDAPVNICAVIDGKILCMHGGLSPEIENLDQIKVIERPIDIPDQGLLCDLLWADPDKDVQGWEENDRGVSVTFGADTVTEFLKKHDLDLICRAHQVVEDGYEFFADQQLVTIFSAPNYCGEFNNAGAMMLVDTNLLCSFQILKPGKTGSSSTLSKSA